MKMIVSLMRNVVTWFYLQLLTYRGTRVLSKLPDHELQLDGISVMSVKGFRVSFYCQEIRYLLTHEKVKLTKEFKMYRLYAVYGDDVPERLKIVTSDEVYLPSIIPSMINQDLRRKLLLESYLDILSDRLNNLDTSEKTPQN